MKKNHKCHKTKNLRTLETKTRDKYKNLKQHASFRNIDLHNNMQHKNHHPTLQIICTTDVYHYITLPESLNHLTANVSQKKTKI